MIDTFGWDTVFACTIDHANRALATSTEALGETLEFEEGGLRIDARLGAWQLVPGGSRQLVHMQVAIATGMLYQGGATIDLAGVAVILEVSLQLLPVAPNAPDAVAKRRLTFKFVAVNTDTKKHGPGLVTFIRVVDPRGDLSPLQQALVGEAVARHLVDDAASVAFAFAEIDLVDHGSESWLCPTHSDYCYVETEGGRALFCIVGVISGHIAEGIEPSVDPGLLDAVHEGFFAISRDSFMQHAVLPMLVGAYPGSTLKSFTYTPATGAITNTEPCSIGKVKGYAPKLNALRVTADRGSLVLHAKGACDMNFLGVSMTFTADARLPLTFDAQRQAISFKADPKPAHSIAYDIPLGVRALILAGGGLVGFLVVEELIVPLIYGGIAESLSKRVGQSMLTQNSVRSTHWTGTKQFTAQEAGLDEAFYLRGRFD